MKKILLFVMLILLTVFIVGCTEAVVDSEMIITSKDGAGIKSINVKVHKDDTGFFPQGYKPVVEYIQSLLPDDFIVTFKEEGDLRVFTITYTFTDINDYNAKTKSMIRDDRYIYEELKPATITYKQVDGGYEVTFTESTKLLHASIIRYITLLHYQDDIFDNTEGGIESRQAGTMLEFDDVTVKIGDSSETVKVTDPNQVDKGIFKASDITVTGFIEGGSTVMPKLPEPTAWPSPSPWPAPSPTPNYWKKMNVDQKDYTFVVVPDTQNYSVWYPEIFESMFDFVADNAEKQNMKLLLHLGDITSNATPLEWYRANSYIRKLDGVLPYVLTLGNHDSKYRKAELFNQYFPVSDFENRPYFGGVFEENLLDNSYYFISAGVHDYLILSLEYGPRDEVVDWANEIVAKYPDHRVILITHAYMGEDGKRLGKDRTYGDIMAYNYREDPNTTINDGEDLWDKLVSRHKNMFMVLSGHVEKDDSQSYRIDEGINGNKVIQMLIDPQSFMRGGDGLMLLLRFSEDGNQIGFEYYSPWRDQHYGEENQFTIDYLNVPLSEPYTPAPDPDPTPTEKPVEEPTEEPTVEETETEEPSQGPTIEEPEPTDIPSAIDDPARGEEPSDNIPDTSDEGTVAYLYMSVIIITAVIIFTLRKRLFKL